LKRVTEVPSPADAADAERLARRLRGEAKVVFAPGLGAAAAEGLFRVAGDDWRPDVLLPAALASTAVFRPPSTFRGRIFLSLPSIPSDVAQRAREEYRELGRRHDLPAQSLPLQRSALASAHLLVEGLRRSGRATTRERLIAALEEMRGYRTGFGPPLTYGPNRRIGCRGAYLATLETSTGRVVPVGGWRDLDAGAPPTRQGSNR
jgi:hypothetical protein